MSIQWIAHRGSSTVAPENTLAAFERALEHGADGVEFDVQFTADHCPVVIHDERVDRTTDGRGAVRELAYQELRRLDAGGWFAPEFAGERIPTLPETLDLLRGRVPRIFPELKGIPGAAEIARFLELLGEYGFEDAATVLAFDWSCLTAVRGGSRRVEIGFEVDRAELFQPALDAAAADPRASLSCRAALLVADPALAARAAARGVAIAAWTVNDAATARTLRDQGVNTLMTDDLALRRRL